MSRSGAFVLSGALGVAAACMSRPAVAADKNGTTVAATGKMVTAASSAPAPSKKQPDAKSLSASGEAKSKAGDFAGALADFEAANALKPSAQLDRSVALCHEQLGHASEAVSAYEKVIAAGAAAGASAQLKTFSQEAKARVEALRAKPGRVAVQANAPGARVWVDAPADAAGTADAARAKSVPAQIELSPGKHTLHVQAEGFEPTEKTIDVAFASTQTVSVDLAKKPEPAEPPPASAEAAAAPPPPVEAASAAASAPEPSVAARSKLPAYVTGAVALVAAGVGTGFGLRALSQSSDFDKSPTVARADEGETSALIADMMFGVALTFGVTSAVLFLTDDAPATPSASASAASSGKPVARVASASRGFSVSPVPYVTPHGGGAGALVRF